MFEVSQQFFFEAAHTLERAHEAECSRRIHGHTYNAEVTLRGEPERETGMVIDLAVLRGYIESIRQMLDHQHLNDIPTLGAPTLENLARFIAEHVRAFEPRVVSVKVWRAASGDSCLFRFPPF
jgi:6-pyruvoyltetrahydropterin/6-carboxytetrahydropterin synthase